MNTPGPLDFAALAYLEAELLKIEPDVLARAMRIATGQNTLKHYKIVA
jgi:hypothetical protein